MHVTIYDDCLDMLDSVSLAGLKDKINELIQLHGPAAWFSLYRYGSDIELQLRRNETTEEFTKRLELEELAKNEKQAREYAHYLKLKEKFGD